MRVRPAFRPGPLALALGLLVPAAPLAAQDADADAAAPRAGAPAESKSRSTSKSKAHAKAKAKDAAARPTADRFPTPDADGKVRLSDAEWRARLEPRTYFVTRQKGTEPAWSGRYARGKHTGTFLCVGCGAELFSSRHKFESGTGWPSFWRPIDPSSLEAAPDYSGVEPRVEVDCARCGAHLGHVFDDGPAPTGQRFCINSVALVLRPEPGAAKDAAKAKARPKAKAKPAGDDADTRDDADAPPAESPPPAPTEPDR